MSCQCSTIAKWSGHPKTNNVVLEPLGPYVLPREDLLFEILLQFNSTGGYLVMNTNFMVRLFFKCILHLWASFTKHKQAVNSHRIKSWSSCINNVNGKLVPANTKRVVWRPEMKDVTENHQLRAKHSKIMKNVLTISTIQICRVSKLEMCSYWRYKGIYVTRSFSRNRLQLSFDLMLQCSPELQRSESK